MRIGHQENGEVVSYTFDVTTLVDLVNKGEIGVKNLVLKMIQETSECDNSIVLYGCSYNGIYAPKLIITYESSYWNASAICITEEKTDVIGEMKEDLI